MTASQPSASAISRAVVRIRRRRRSRSLVFRSPAGIGPTISPAAILAPKFWRYWYSASRLIAAALLLTGAPQVIRRFLIAAAVIPVADAIIVLRHHGPRATAFGVHGATAVFLVVVAGLLLIR
ncbi:MAG TPA: DUF4267 domain-containing protein [Candidatus Dormibacteraeota bacterium]|nr:DUF4267 domain-containing protein [Candidatus Dormibacteraeota bacterium]